jgi:FMN phosphatase YigB (HAD superfamily)
LRPRFVTFDCYGTLIDFQLARVTREVLRDRLGAEEAPGFLRAFSAYRLDEAMGGKVYVNRGYEPSAPGFGYREVGDLSALPRLFA